MDLSLALVPSQVMTAMRYLSFIFIASLVTLPTSLCAQVAVRDTLPAAQITARRIIRLDTGHIETSLDGIRSVASPLGEGDPIRWIQSLPGVATGADGTSASYVRGGNIGGNLVTIDGIPVYGYSHILGLTTVIPSDAIQSATFSKGGFVGSQGNFTASHIALTTKDPSSEIFKSDVFLNNFLAGGSISGPVSKRLSFSASARLSPLGLEYRMLSGIMGGGLGELENFGADVYDLHGKLSWQISDSRKLTFSVLGSRDVYAFDTRDASREKIGWENAIGSIHYHSDRARSKWDLSAAFNHYGSLQEQDKTYKGEDYHFSLRSMMSEASLSAKWTRPFGNYFIMQAGLSGRYAAFDPGRVGDVANGYDVLYGTAFIEGSFKKRNLFLDGTVRMGGFHSDTLLVIPDIIFAMRWQATDQLAVEATFDRMNQCYHTLEGLPVGWSMDLLIPSTSRIPAEHVIQGYAGVIGTFGNHTFSAGVYAKELTNVIYYKDAQNFFTPAPIVWEESCDIGKGDSRGLEFLYEFAGRDMYVQFSATLSQSTRKDFKEVNEGRPFHAPFDRRLVLNASMEWHRFRLAFIYQDGNWVNGRGEKYVVTIPGDEVTLDYFSSINNHQMPATVRLDAGYQFLWEGPRVHHSLNVGVCNLFNHFNPFTVYYDTIDNVWKELALLPIMPNFSYRISF